MGSPGSKIPLQQIGRQTDYTHNCTLPNLEEAHAVFKQAAERLLTINLWHEYAGSGSAKFTLCNNSGNALTGFAAEGFFISIDLPGLGANAGGGLEWVIIENMEAGGDGHSAEEYLLFTARPVPDPRENKTMVAHFYSDRSTNTFMLHRDGRVVTAGAHGRNESPNNEDVDLHDKIRNTAIALMARVGLSGGQWQKLVNGIMECTVASSKN